MIRRIAWLIATVMALGLSLLGRARPVAAHAFLISADPSPGTELIESPPEIRLNFSEPLESGSTFLLFGPGFTEVAGLSPGIDPASPELLFSAAVPSLSPDTYTVQWTAISADDFEATGSYAFSVLPQSRGISFAILSMTVIGLLVIAIIVLISSRRKARHT